MITPIPSDPHGPADGSAPLDAATPAKVERLTTSECWTLLQQTQLGRLAVVHVDGTPDIFPVNYVPHEGALFIRTARDTKLLHIAHHPPVAFEVDGETDDSRWSVVVRGPAERVTSDAEIRGSGVRGLASWSPTAKHYVIKVTAHAVTGRRFPKNQGRLDDLVPFQGAEALAPPPPPPTPDRAHRPEPIPHRSPAHDTGGGRVDPADGSGR